MGIITFLLNNKTLVFILLAAAIIGSQALYITTLRAEAGELAAESEKFKTLLDVSQANIMQLQTDIKVQNAEILKWKTAADIKSAENAEAVKKAQQASADYAAKAEELLKAYAPQTVSRCDAANSLINGEIKNVKK